MQWLTKAMIALGLSLITQIGAAAELPFETGEVARRVVMREHLLDGTVEAVKEATISAQTSGRIVELLYDVDDFVPPGSVVVRFRDTEQRARFKQAEASLEEATARHNEAKKEFDRIEDVYAKKLVSKSQMDSATAALKAAKARLDAAKAALGAAEEQLEYTRVRAPYGGIVTARHVEVGEVARVGQPLISGVSLNRLRANVNVPQRLINRVREHGRARVILTEQGEQSVDAEKLTFFPYADERSNTFKVRVELPEGVKGLFPGMFVKVAFTTGEKVQLVVSEKAVVYRSEVTGVYVVNPDGRVALRQVRVGRKTADDMIEVHAGLSEGERVALEPIRAGVYVKKRAAEIADE